MSVGNVGRKRKRKVERRRGADEKAIELVKNSLSAPMELPTSLYVQADDLDRPRGGGSVPRLKEEAEARMEAEDVFERRKKDSRKKAKTGKKGSKRPPADIEDDLSSLFGNDLRFDHRVPFKIDVDRQSMTLVMKKSYIGNANDVDRRHDIGDDHDVASSMEDVLLGLHYKDSLPDYQKISGHDSGGCENLIQSGTRVSVPPLQVILNDSEASDGDNPVIANHNDVNENCEAAKRNRYMKKKVKEEKELKISASEERLLKDDMPRTEDEFEKLVRVSPNCSFVWIKYMAYILSLADIEKARSIAERALRTINIREEGEKLNICVAYFNLEKKYGSQPEEAVKKIFERALQCCDPKKLYLALLGVYERNEQQDLADELLASMTKKFKHSCKVWLRYVWSFLKKYQDGIQSIVNRALTCLPHKKHTKFISQTALLEFKSGIPDRGRSMFESILREYPKRTDLWSIYLDQEIRLGDEEVIRNLFERATCLSLPPKKMKFLFTKYLNYEKAHGDEDRVEHVKRKALEYVESSLI